MRHKASLALLFLVFVLPFAVIFYLLLTEINGQIDFSETEKVGLSYCDNLQKLEKDLLQLQSNLNAAQTGLAATDEAMNSQRTIIDSDIAGLTSDDKTNGELLDSTAGWTKIRNQWPAVREASRTALSLEGDAMPASRARAARAVSEDITEMAQDIIELIAHVGDNANDPAHPLLKGYYYGDMVVKELPQLTQKITASSNLGADVLTRRKITGEERDQLIVWSTTIRTQLDSMDQSLKGAFKADPDPTIPLAVYSKAVSASDKFLLLTTRKFGTKRIIASTAATSTETIDSEPREYFEVSRAALMGQFDFYDSLFSRLDALLESRSGQLAAQKAFVELFAIIVLTVAVYVFLGFAASQNERMRAEESAHESEARTRSVIDNALDAVMVMDGDGRITEWNPQAEVLFGWPRAMAVGQLFHDLIVPERHRALLQQLQSGGGSLINRRVELTAHHRDGHEFTVELAVSVIHTKRGYSFSAFVRDITERKETEQAQQQAREAAEEANRSKSQFLANMSHELRTPLNAIIGYSEMLQEEAEESGVDSLTPDLQKIHTAGIHLLSLINDILDLSKIEAGKMELFLETFDLRTIIGEVVATIHPLMEKNSNKLKVEMASDVGLMHADLTKIRQNLFNLLSNASKFTEHGIVTLRVTRVTEQGRDWIAFDVADNGIGMTAEQITRLFQAFTQADASTTRKYGGTGLGLAITWRFCHMMGGDITVKSDPGKGTTFTIKLPAQVLDPKAVVQQVAAAVSAPDLTRTDQSTVLVIDDDPIMHDLMHRYLESAGFRVVTCGSGHEGLRLARELRPDAITLDVLMPGMDGWAVLTELKADPETAAIPVVMLTLLQDRNIGYALGVSDYLTKPIEGDKLIAVLSKYRHDRHDAPVLIVEDDPNTRHMLQRMLEKEGWPVREAENGRVALERVAEVMPGIILLDLMMPEMDGFEFVAELRRHPEWAQIPVVVVTAKDITQQDRLRLNGNVQQILQKGSYSREMLIQEVRDMVAGCVVPRGEVKD